ncbi:hypothetical protein NDU88_000640 [Pleurodeles waltl]|uniref:Uncharacterized protein n=1 Tax=Pleurodeles waltl TaxID=8319 RepID=A0AAV7VU40_PLEWA|nr:hypothetical protein NDU88_000640 [Pleurodeles waltl]
MFSGPPPSIGVQPKYHMYSFYGGPTSCRRRLSPRAAFLAQSRHPAARLLEFRSQAAQGPPQHPSADRISWAVLAMPGSLHVTALPQLRLRRQHTPPARATAPPPASPGRRPRQLRSQAMRSPSSSQAIKN